MNGTGRVVAAVAVLTVLGAIVRAGVPLAAGFPLNDGGLFYQMVLDLERTLPGLPTHSTYNDIGTPFAYPPIGFYLGALLHGVLGFDVMRVVPVVAATLTIPAFFLLARSLLGSPGIALVATALFALAPRSFEWLTMGGGLTRAPGLLGALLALWLTRRLLLEPSWGRAIAAGVAGGAVVLTHPQAALFTALSGLLFCIPLLRSRRALALTAAAAGVAALIVLPWISWVVATHGLGPISSASGTQPGPFIGVLALFSFELTGSRIFDVIGLFAAAGAIVSIVRGRWFLPAWLAAAMIFDSRGGATYAIIPGAMLAAQGLLDLVVRPIWRPDETLPMRPTAFARRFPARTLIVVGVLLLTFVDALGSQLAPNWPGVALPAPVRAAMEELAADDDARYLVVTDRPWPIDATAEWFPTLTGQQSVATVQGYEWLGTSTFQDRIDAHDELRRCVARDAACLETWAADVGVEYTHVFVPKGQLAGPLSLPDCCPALRLFLADDPGYRVTHDGPGATIFERLDD